MINNHNVVYWINLLSLIEPNLVGPIIPRFVNLDERAINEPNAILEFHHICVQHNSLLCYGPSNFISNHINDARCSEDDIITNCTLWPIPCKCIICGNIIMFHIQNELYKVLLWGQFWRMPSPNVVITCKSQLLIVRLNPNPNLKSKPLKLKP